MKMSPCQPHCPQAPAAHPPPAARHLSLVTCHLPLALMLLVALAFRGLPASAASALHASTNATVLRALSTPRNHYFAPKPSAAALAHAQSQRLAPASTTNTKSPLSPVPGGGPLTSIRTSWEGTPSDFTLDPPDPSGAAGPNGILATVNERIAYFDKSGRSEERRVGKECRSR